MGRAATVAGVITGGVGVPLPAERFAEVGFTGPHLAWATGLGRVVRDSDGSYSTSVAWYGPSSVAGTLHAIEMELVATRPVSYDGYGSRPFSLSDGGTFGNRDGSTPSTSIALRSIGERTVSGMLNPPPGYDPVAWFNVGPFWVDTADNASGGPYSTVLPTGIPELTTYVQVHAERSVGVEVEVSEATIVIGDSVTALDLTTPAAPALLLPVADAVAVDYDTVFSYTPPPDSVCTVAFFLGNAWLVELVEQSSSVTIPDLTGYGIGPARLSRGARSSRRGGLGAAHLHGRRLRLLGGPRKDPIHAFSQVVRGIRRDCVSPACLA